MGYQCQALYQLTSQLSVLVALVSVEHGEEVITNFLEKRSEFFACRLRGSCDGCYGVLLDEGYVAGDVWQETAEFFQQVGHVGLEQFWGHALHEVSQCGGRMTYYSWDRVVQQVGQQWQQLLMEGHLELRLHVIRDLTQAVTD
jgi:hypothetical protein